MSGTPTLSAADLAHRARRYGARDAATIVTEARRAGLLVSEALALVEMESGFRNIFGHDWGSDPRKVPFPGMPCTRTRVHALLKAIDNGSSSNGVGLTQLTWPPFIRKAEAMGGAHLPVYQCRVAFELLKDLIAQHGRHGGFKAYNGSGPAAERYADRAVDLVSIWHERLT